MCAKYQCSLAVVQATPSITNAWQQVYCPVDQNACLVSMHAMQLDSVVISVLRMAAVNPPLDVL